MSPATIHFENGVTLELLSKDSLFRGIGAVALNSLPLRSGRLPMFVDIRTPGGERLTNFRLTSQEAQPERLRLTFSAEVYAGGPMDWMVHETRPRWNVADWEQSPTPAPDTTLTLDIVPLTQTLGGVTLSGIRYQYHYHSAAFPIYKILDRATWEPGGQAIGAEFWLRSCFSPAISRFETAAHSYSSEWYLPSAANPNIFQFLPWQTELPGMTFTASDFGSLFTWSLEPSHLRSLFDKPRHANEIRHWHEHCGDLGADFVSAPIDALFAPGALDTVARFNLYEAARDYVHGELHQKAGLRPEQVTTYGQIEEWTNADLPRYTRLGVPKLLDAGMETIYFANHFENNMNTWGVGNMCCTGDWRVPDTVGKANLTDLCQAIKAGGAKPEMWGNTALSSFVHKLHDRSGQSDRIQFPNHEGSVFQVLEQAADPFIRTPSNAIEADHYTPVFEAINLRDPHVRAHWLKQWGLAHNEIGLEGIFLDSSFNMSSDKFHYVQNPEPGAMDGATADQTHLLGAARPASEPPGKILSQYHAHLSLMAAMQEMGYQYCNEDLGVFGIHRHGPGIETRLSSLPLWADTITAFDIPAIENVGADPDDIFFRGLAYRQMYFVHWNIEGDYLSFSYTGAPDAPLSDWSRVQPKHIALFKAYNQVRPHLGERVILPDETGVLYRSGSFSVLWAFQDLTLPLDGPASVTDILADQADTLTGRLEAQSHRVYLININD